VGRALRPVEQLRRGAEEITDAAAERRLPVPSGDDEVHRLALTLNGMIDRLEGGRRRQRAFVADAAHELRSPLASIRTQLEVAARRADRGGPALSGSDVADVLLDTDRLARLIDDLLLLARIDESGGVAGCTDVVELRSLCAEVVARCGSSVTLAGGQSVTVRGDREQLRRVVSNLVDNAVRHAASSVTVAVTRSGRDALLSIVDDGPGIPEADRNRVFERFTRLDDARARDQGGAGLGLAIVRELVRGHGGSVVLGDAAPGLRVEVRLPAEPADPAD
jgi:signal transduction histidine kinase